MIRSMLFCLFLLIAACVASSSQLEFLWCDSTHSVEIFPNVNIPIPDGYESPSVHLSKMLITTEMMEISQLGNANMFYGIVANKLQFVRKDRLDDCCSSVSVKCLASNGGERPQGRFKKKSYAELNSAKPNHSNVVAIKNQRRMLKMWHDECVRNDPFVFDRDVVRNDDGSMTFKKIPAGGEMLHMAMNAKLEEMPKVTEDVRLPFLFPPAGEGIEGTLLDYVDEKENFRLKLPIGFSRLPERKTISEWVHGCGFQGRHENEWAYVEHFIVSADHLNERMEGWVALAVMLLGKPLIHPHAKASRIYDLVQFSRVPAICSQWMKSHCAAEMVSWIGTIRRGA